MSIRRISVDDQPLVTARCHVFLDGIELSNCCVAADPIDGWADVIDELYRYPGTPFPPEGPTRIRLYGRVRIEAVE